MNHCVLPLFIRTLVLIGLFSQPNLALSKEKPVEKSDVADVALLGKQEVSELLQEGAFWCMLPEGTTCLFTSEVTFSDDTNFVYLVISEWEDGVIFKEYYNAYLRDDGTLCEPAILNFSKMGWTDLHGVPVDGETLEKYKSELSDWFGPEEKPDRCFRYGYVDPGNTESLTQFTVLENGKLVEPIPFFVDLSDNASRDHFLRLGNDN